LAALLGIEIEVIEQLLAEQFEGRERLIRANVDALHMGRDWVRDNMAPWACRSAGPMRSATGSSSRATRPPA
ncbi:MAG: hypothetical protein ACK5T5_06210, partial [Phenylobacterium sp.]